MHEAESKSYGYYLKISLLELIEAFVTRDQPCLPASPLAISEPGKILECGARACRLWPLQRNLSAMLIPFNCKILHLEASICKRPAETLHNSG